MVGKLTSNQVATNCCNSTSADPDVSPDYAGAVLMIGLAVAIIASNSLILVAILTFRKLRNNYDYLFVFSLSLCDILVGLLNVPYEATVFILWHPSPLTCATLRAIQVTLKTTNFLNVALITLNKYIKIFYPFRYPFLVTGKTVCAALIFAWAFPVAWAAYAVQKLARAESVRVDMQCFQEKPPKQLAIVFFTTKFLLPALFLLICTTRIALLIRDQHRRIASLNVSATGQASEPSSVSMASQQHLTKKGASRSAFGRVDSSDTSPFMVSNQHYLFGYHLIMYTMWWPDLHYDHCEHAEIVTPELGNQSNIVFFG
ncbi:D(1)-like dopamine receptor [Ptychodera flava]|uniref:D(1)-like dopamine receptor n=1 Tax=Ptychodera flava TaxID=63121 RepID=UPI00396AA8E9